VLPDNGLISGVALSRSPEGVWEITNPAIRRAKATFHGREYNERPHTGAA
jgi:S-adenosylmethionine hydrolase